MDNEEAMAEFIFDWFNDRDPDEMKRCLDALAEQRSAARKEDSHAG